MILTDLLLNNFQIHKELLLEFTKGVNTIVGESDVGKSSVIRALDLLIRNQPKGGEQLYQNDTTEDPLRIELHDNDGNIVIRENKTYDINGEKVTTFGSGVPEQLTDVFPFKDINFQFQFDPYFLILETGGKAAEIINQATGLGDQELIIGIIKKQITDSRRLLKTLIKQKEACFGKIEELKSVPHLLMKVRAVINLEKEYDEITQIIRCIEENIFDLCRVEEELVKYSNLDVYKQNLEKICGEEIEYQNRIKKASKIKLQVENLKLLEQDFIFYKKADKFLKPINEILSLPKEWNEIAEGIMKLHFFKSKLEDLGKEWMKTEMIIDELKMRLEDGLRSFNICPLCGSNIMWR